jgi:hypothetical protein
LWTTVFYPVLLFLLLPISSLTEVKTLFKDITKESKLNFTHDPQLGGKYFFPEEMGAGCASFDFDNDNDVDIYFVNGGEDQLFRQDENVTFTNVTSISGLNDKGYAMGVAVGEPWLQLFKLK